MRTIADEVVLSLRDDAGTELSAGIDIRVPHETGCDDDKAGAVSENVKTGKFDDLGIERS